MNEINNLLEMIPAKYRTAILLCLAVSPYITRAFHALITGGGIKGIFSAIWLGTNTPKPDQGGSKLPPIVLLALLAPLALILGCAPLQPGADPLVVNCERTETMAKASFDLVLHIDAAHRSFWQTNTPAFHEFCETLREPHTIGTNTLPFCSATILALDNIKQDYKASRASSNALYEAIVTVNSLSSQAASWLTVVTNQP